MPITPSNFDDISDLPADLTSAKIIMRMTDALAFRYRWATHNIPQSIADFTPSPACMTLNQLFQHIYKLSNWTREFFTGSPSNPPSNSPSQNPDPSQMTLAELTAQTLNALALLHNHLEKTTDAQLAKITDAENTPLLYMINGPIADALTHTGQIITWRKLANSPPPSPNYFRGSPPKP